MAMVRAGTNELSDDRGDHSRKEVLACALNRTISSNRFSLLLPQGKGLFEMDEKEGNEHSYVCAGGTGSDIHSTGSEPFQST